MSVNDLDVLNIAGYKFEPLDDVEVLVPEFQSVCNKLELKGSVYLSPNGINFSLGGSEESIQQYVQFMEQDERFLNIPLKKTYSETQPFRRMKVRPKKEIISLGRDDINPRELTGGYVTPQELYTMYENKEDVIVLDTRNEYETRVGLFENAVDLQLDTFRDFPDAIEKLPEEYKNKQIVMYCTGGIRCEKASAVMLKAGFSDVKQLEGGVLDYFKETGGKYWNGDCFVFDERVALDTELNETEYIYCYICREPLSAKEKASPDFKINEYCPYCVTNIKENSQKS
uniref:tRNA uridine(34) hydroxylase n=1 Tax=Candidatus Actinomarina minuta TaxID=1389454 RepID=S5DJC6_9ACTN|nr:putative sulfurtransferase [Candidatus Actinomarina minuta]